MKHVIAVLAVFSLLFAVYSCNVMGTSDDQTKENDEMFELSGEILKTSSYCEGAPSSPDLIEELNTQKPVSGKTLYIKEGDTNDLSEDPIAEVTTDENGVFTVNLSPGTYTIIEERKLELPDPDDYAPSDLYEVDMECLENHWTKPDKLIEVSSDTTIEVTYHESCFWEKPCLKCKLEGEPCPIPS